MTLPQVMSEDETLARAAAGVNLARFGDGELRLAVGGVAVSQRDTSWQMQEELKAILRAQRTGCLVCLPNFTATPNKDIWANYAAAKFVRLFGQKQYGSAFITRPDNAPWIDRDDYWARVRDLWRGRNVVLVCGDRKSITDEMLMLTGADSVELVHGPAKNAYAEINRIERDIVSVCARMHNPLVLMCLGVTATVLAWRLAGRVHAIDLGHIGTFMRHAGAYRYAHQDLLSQNYQKQLQKLHSKKKWGADGAKHVEPVISFAKEVACNSILDYGCGEGMLAKALAPRRVFEYDPGIRGKERLPKPADMIVCTDVLEHVEQERVPVVLDHIFRLTAKAAYFVIALRPANAILPDGRNAHLTVQEAEWWRKKVADAGFNIVREDVKPGREMALWLQR